MGPPLLVCPVLCEAQKKKDLLLLWVSLCDVFLCMCGCVCVRLGSYKRPLTIPPHSRRLSSLHTHYVGYSLSASFDCAGHVFTKGELLR